MVEGASGSRLARWRRLLFVIAGSRSSWRATSAGVLLSRLRTQPSATGETRHPAGRRTSCRAFPCSSNAKEKFLDQNAAPLTAMALPLSLPSSPSPFSDRPPACGRPANDMLAIAEKAVETARLRRPGRHGRRAGASAGELSRASNLDKPLENARLEAGPEPDIAAPVEPPCIDYVLSNVGRTAALLREVRHALAWDSPRGIAELPSGRGRAAASSSPPTSDSRTAYAAGFVAISRRARRGPCVAGTRALLFYGDASFVDAFGQAEAVNGNAAARAGTSI